MARFGLSVLVFAFLLSSSAWAQNRPDGEARNELITSVQCWLPDAQQENAIVLDMTGESRRQMQMTLPDIPGNTMRRVFVVRDKSVGVTTELRVYSIDFGVGNTVEIVCTVGLPR